MSEFPNVRNAIVELEEQKRTLAALLQKIEAQLSRVDIALQALTALESDEPITFKGSLADACRIVLHTHKGSLSPMEVRDKVKALGYNLRFHENEMAAVHGVLKRLAESGEAGTKEFKSDPDVTRYFWAAPKPPNPFTTNDIGKRLSSILTPKT